MCDWSKLIQIYYACRFLFKCYNGVWTHLKSFNFTSNSHVLTCNPDMYSVYCFYRRIYVNTRIKKLVSNTFDHHKSRVFRDSSVKSQPHLFHSEPVSEKCGHTTKTKTHLWPEKATLLTVSAESHGFAIFPALFQTFFQFCTWGSNLGRVT